MITAVLVAATAWLLSAGCAPALARRLPPATAARLLTATGAAVAGGGIGLALLVALPWFAQLPALVTLGPWSGAALRAGEPAPGPVAVALAAAALVGAAHADLLAVRRIRAMAAVRRACADLPRADRLAVLASDRPEAFSTPPPAGRVVLSSGLFDRLSPDELRVVLAHEESHLRHGHAWYVLAAELAAAANPLLRPIARSVRDTVERWADEDAARAVADRRLAARALARTALLTRTAATPVATLAGADRGVPGRVAALLGAAPRRRLLPALVLSALLLVGLAAAGLVERRTDAVLDHAHLTVSAVPPIPPDVLEGSR
ncbi:M48 family metalloprotease [Micromonospora sp. RTP1Z1]|uniref:M48 family metalloprotease n=1 Tax=Micromonospora sp. RTP1Z1 TaxID=2994043 RepID=UPI0029C7C8FD|nr:M48 family metalloprotease [Micromonospora sp. RTP1Z1]